MISTSSTSGQIGSRTRGLNVLLVDHNVADIGFLRSLLSRTRLAIHGVTEVRTLQAAFAELTSPAHAFDVVLLDLGLRDASGVDGATRIAQVAPHVPVIAVAGNEQDLETGATTQYIEDYLVKWEFDPSLLARSIRYAVERHDLRTHLTAEKARAQRVNRTKAEFLANMGLELRTPMNIMLGMADLLRARPLSPNQAARTLSSGVHAQTLGAPRRTASGTMTKVNLDINALVTALASKASPIRLLLADDSIDNHELLEAYVADLPIVVHAVSSGEAALGEFAADVFDLVLVDMHMPGMNGCATLRALREREREVYAEPTPMLVMSADVLRESVEEARQAGADGFLAKPVRRNTVLEAILHHCGDGEPECQAPPSEELPPIDSVLLPILPRFLINREADCEGMREATGRRDFARVAVLAHNLKGTGGAFGFPELSALGGKLEKLAKAGNASEILRSLDDLSVLLGRVSRALAQTVTEPASTAAPTGRRLA